MQDFKSAAKTVMSATFFAVLITLALIFAAEIQTTASTVMQDAQPDSVEVQDTCTGLCLLDTN